MGVVKRALEAAGVNWGYFFDHNPFEPHCNSHPNNFLVLPPVSHFNCWSNPNSLSVRTKPKNLRNHWEPSFATVHYWYITIGTFQINFAKVSHNNYWGGACYLQINLVRFLHKIVLIPIDIAGSCCSVGPSGLWPFLPTGVLLFPIHWVLRPRAVRLMDGIGTRGIGTGPSWRDCQHWNGYDHNRCRGVNASCLSLTHSITHTLTRVHTHTLSCTTELVPCSPGTRLGISRHHVTRLQVCILSGGTNKYSPTAPCTENSHKCVNQTCPHQNSQLYYIIKLVCCYPMHVYIGPPR